VSDSRRTYAFADGPTIAFPPFVSPTHPVGGVPPRASRLALGNSLAASQRTEASRSLSAWGKLGSREKTLDLTHSDPRLISSKSGGGAARAPSPCERVLHAPRAHEDDRKAAGCRRQPRASPRTTSDHAPSAAATDQVGETMGSLVFVCWMGVLVLAITRAARTLFRARRANASSRPRALTGRLPPLMRRGRQKHNHRGASSYTRSRLRRSGGRRDPPP